MDRVSVTLKEFAERFDALIASFQEENARAWERRRLEMEENSKAWNQRWLEMKRRNQDKLEKIEETEDMQVVESKGSKDEEEEEIYPQEDEKEAKQQNFQEENESKEEKQKENDEHKKYFTSRNIQSKIRIKFYKKKGAQGGSAQDRFSSQNQLENVKKNSKNLRTRCGGEQNRQTNSPKMKTWRHRRKPRKKGAMGSEGSGKKKWSHNKRRQWLRKWRRIMTVHGRCQQRQQLRVEMKGRGRRRRKKGRLIVSKSLLRSGYRLKKMKSVRGFVIMRARSSKKKKKKKRVQNFRGEEERTREKKKGKKNITKKNSHVH